MIFLPSSDASKDGDISNQVMYNTFNMGIGMVIVLAPEEASMAIDILGKAERRHIF